jgi:preprotein translocase subunit Sss1
MKEVICQLNYIKEHLKFVSRTTEQSVDFDVEVLGNCVAMLEEMAKKPSEDEIVKMLQKVSWKSYSDVAKRNLLWLNDAIDIVRDAPRMEWLKEIEK